MATEIASSQIIHVAGFAGDAHFQKTANIAAALEHLVGSKKLRVRIIEHASAEEFSKWAQEKIGQLNSRGITVDPTVSPLFHGRSSYG